MIRFGIALAAAAALFVPQAEAQTCPQPGSHTLGVARTLTVDTTGGPLYGNLQYKGDLKLGPKEVILTFDDGPISGKTPAILDTLDKYCVKATFFVVGRMVKAYPEIFRDTIKRGHTIGTHTWSHPNLGRMGLDKVKAEIEKAFNAAVSEGGPVVAPFFRFPYLSDSKAAIAYLQSRNISAFSVDILSDDHRKIVRQTVIENVMRGIKKNNDRGIILMHDIQARTAQALPALLERLRDDGYKIVHLKASSSLQQVADAGLPDEPQDASGPRTAGIPAPVRANDGPAEGQSQDVSTTGSVAPTLLELPNGNEPVTWAPWRQ